MKISTGLFLFLSASWMTTVVTGFTIYSSPMKTQTTKATRTTTSLHAAAPHPLHRSVSNALGSFAVAASLAMGTTVTALPPLPVHAESAKVVGEIRGSGLVFKDTLQIERFEDPKVKGVTLYISNFQIPLAEKVAKNKIFSDPSDSSVTCAKTGKVSIADNIAKGPGGEEVFEESKSLLFKSLRVQRIYDDESNTVVYVSYNTRLSKDDDSNKSRFKTSLCAVDLD